MYIPKEYKVCIDERRPSPARYDSKKIFYVIVNQNKIVKRLALHLQVQSKLNFGSQRYPNTKHKNEMKSSISIGEQILVAGFSLLDNF